VISLLHVDVLLCESIPVFQIVVQFEQHLAWAHPNFLHPEEHCPLRCNARKSGTSTLAIWRKNCLHIQCWRMSQTSWPHLFICYLLGFLFDHEDAAVFSEISVDLYLSTLHPRRHSWQSVLWDPQMRLHTCQYSLHIDKQTNQTPWHESESELYRPSDLCLSPKLVPTFADRRVSRSQRCWFPAAVISVF
jgi:hypothetical protein